MAKCTRSHDQMLAIDEVQRAVERGEFPGAVVAADERAVWPRFDEVGGNALSTTITVRCTSGNWRWKISSISRSARGYWSVPNRARMVRSASVPPPSAPPAGAASPASRRSCSDRPAAISGRPASLCLAVRLGRGHLAKLEDQTDAIVCHE